MQNSRVVLIDDDLDFLKLIERQCDSSVEEFQGFSDPRKGVEAILETQPDIVICDYQMPEMSGPDLVAHLRVHGYHQPIIFLTAEMDLDLVLMALRLGASDVLSKSINKYELLKAINRTLAMERLKKAIYCSNSEEELNKNSRLLGLFQRIANKAS